MAEQQTTQATEPVVSTPEPVQPAAEEESFAMQVVDEDEDEMVQASVTGQDATQPDQTAPTEEAPAEEKPAEPAIPPAIQAELDKLKEENRKIQSAKDREVAAVQQQLQAEQQQRIQYEQQYTAWQQQQAAAEAEAERIKQELEFKQWWDAAPPEQRAAYEAANTFITNAETEKRQQADALRQQAIQAEGIPQEWLDEQLQADYSPTAIKAAVLMYRQWRDHRDRTVQARLLPIKDKLREAQQFRMMSPEQRRVYVESLPPERKQTVIARLQKGRLAVAGITNTVGAAPVQTPQPVAAAPVTPVAQEAVNQPPPAVTPGSTSQTPPSNLAAELSRAVRRNDHAKVAELRRALGRASGVDQTLD